MGAAGWIAKADAGAICGFEGIGTLFLERRDAARALRLLLPLQRAGRGADPGGQRDALLRQGERGDRTLRVLVRGATGRHAAPLRRRDVRARPWPRAAPTGSSSGIYNEGDVPIALTTSRANNVVFVSGWVTLADPTAPAVAANGPTGVQTGLSALLQWSASDPESGAPAVAYSVDGGTHPAARAGLLVAVRHARQRQRRARPERPRRRRALGDRLRAVVRRRGRSYGPFVFRVDRTAPAQPQIHVVPDAAAAAAGWWGHAPSRSRCRRRPRPTSSARGCACTAPSGAVVLDETAAGALGARSVPASAFDRARRATRSTSSNATSRATARARRARPCAGTAAAPPVPADGTAAPLGLLAARDGAHLTWPARGRRCGGSGVAGAFRRHRRRRRPRRARKPLAAARWEAGVPGVSESAIPAAAIHGAARSASRSG